MCEDGGPCTGRLLVLLAPPGLRGCWEQVLLGLFLSQSSHRPSSCRGAFLPQEAEGRSGGCVLQCKHEGVCVLLFLAEHGSEILSAII